MSQAPFTSASFAVGIPTRSRPDRLARCLESLEAARRSVEFPAYICDSSPTEELRSAVREVCERYSWTHYSTHQGTNVAAARNACAQAAAEDLMINVDDDLELEPQAIENLVRRYSEGSGRRVVGGSIFLNGAWSKPVKKTLIGYGRPVRDGEEPDFVMGAYFLYPRLFALTWPWNERSVTADDIYMGALWRSHGVRIMFADDSRVIHEEPPTSADPARLAETVEHQRWHIYALLFDSLVANPSIFRTLCYETIGFTASAKVYVRRRALVLPFLRSWLAGHVRFVKDLRYLRRQVKTEIATDG